MSQYHIDQGATSTPSNVCLKVFSLIVSWNAWVADGSTFSFSYSCFHYLPWYDSECTCRSHVGPWLHTCKSMGWDSPGKMVNMHWGCSRAAPARFCAQHGTKSTALGSLSFFFVSSKDFAM